MNDIFTAMTEHLPDILFDCYKRYLEIESNDQLRFTGEFFLEVGEEMDFIDEIDELPSPERFTKVMTLGDVHTPTFSIGYV